MTSFVEAVKNQSERTTNGMKALKSTGGSVVDLFFKAGAMRGKNIVPEFTAALVENEELTIRLALWLRDVRSGAGERELFRQILKHLEKTRPELAERLLVKTPELGRWDDIFVFETPELKAKAFTMLGDALRERNGLAAKWTPRQGPLAAEIRSFFGMSPKFYRKSLVEMTKVVEQQMCANKWDDINFNHVPSVAASRYKKAFKRHTVQFEKYVEKLAKGEAGVKVNASAVYPYDVLKNVHAIGYYGATELKHVDAQWAALPNYVGDASILPLVDVSGSMTCIAGGKGSTSCLDIAVSLGLYLSEKNEGKFKDLFLTFSSKPEMLHLKGTIVQRVQQMVRSKWEMGTNLHAAMQKILDVAVDGNVPQEEMPKMLLILSDMQFNQCARYDDSALQMIKRKYVESGYEAPQIVFWNLNAYDNAPVKMDAKGIALVSGFSPAIVKSVLAADMEEFTPEGIMMKTLMSDRYSV